MAEEVEKLSGKLGIDTTDFKTALREANRELRVLESGFRASAAGLGDWANDASGLEHRIESLTKKIDIQRLKVNAMREEYERVADEKGKNSAAAKNLEIRLNKETETLGKMERELGDTSDKLEELKRDSELAAKGVDKLDKEQKQAAKSSLTLKGAISGLGKGIKASVGAVVAAAKALVAMTAAVAGLAVGLVAFTVGPASDLQETISKTEVVFGSAAEQVLAFGETSAEALGLSKNAALGAAATYGNLLRAMGLTEQESADMSTELVQLAADLASFNNMDPTEVLDKLRAGLTGEAEPLKVLGVNMNQARIEAEALALGLIKEGEELTAAAKAQAAYSIILKDTTLAQGDFARTSDGLANQTRTIKALFEDLRATIGTALLPVVELAAQALSGFMQSAEFTEGLEEVIGWIERFADILGLAFGENADLEKFGEELNTFILELVQTFADMAVEMLPVGLNIILNLVQGIIGAIPVLLPAAIDIVLQLVHFIIRNLPMLVEAGINAIITLATGLAKALPELIPAVVEAVVMIVEILLDNMPLIIEAALLLIMGLAEGLVEALPILIEAIPVIVKAIFDAIIKALPLIGKAAVQLVKTLTDGIKKNIYRAVSAGKQLIKEVINGIKGLIYQLWQVGADIVEGLWQGIVDNWNWLKTRVSNLFATLVGGVKDELEEHSPSGVFAEIGKNMALGLGIGFEREFERMRRAMEGSVGSLRLSAVSAQGGLGRLGTQNEAYTFYGPVYLSGGQSKLSQALKGRRF